MFPYTLRIDSSRVACFTGARTGERGRAGPGDADTGSELDDGVSATSPRCRFRFEFGRISQSSLCRLHAGGAIGGERCGDDVDVDCGDACAEGSAVG